MTTKQKEYIEFIEEFSGVKFKGNPNSNKEKARLASADNWAIINGY